MAPQILVILWLFRLLIPKSVYVMLKNLGWWEICLKVWVPSSCKHSVQWRWTGARSVVKAHIGEQPTQLVAWSSYLRTCLIGMLFMIGSNAQATLLKCRFWLFFSLDFASAKHFFSSEYLFLTKIKSPNWCNCFKYCGGWIFQGVWLMYSI